MRINLLNKFFFAGPVKRKTFRQIHTFGTDISFEQNSNEFRTKRISKLNREKFIEFEEKKRQETPPQTNSHKSIEQ